LLAEGQVSAISAKLTLIKMMKGVTTEDREILQCYIQNIDALAPSKVTKQAHMMPGTMPDPSKGKLMQLYTTILKSVRTELHTNIKTDTKQTMQYDMMTGQMMLNIPEEQQVPSVAIFNMTMENFRHAVRANDYLGEMEMHTLIQWICKQFVLLKKLVVIERTVKQMLKLLDADMGLELTKMVCTEARDLLVDQQELYDKEIFRSNTEKPGQEKTAAEKKTAAAAARSGKTNQPGNADPNRHALIKPNSISCWFWTNGYDCKHKTAAGVCNYAHNHGTCGFERADGAMCTASHRATEHTDAAATWNK
jgi:hypothetical protein